MLRSDQESFKMNASLGLIIGGLIPAVLFGVGALFQKRSNDIGIGQSDYLLCFSVGIILAALASVFLFGKTPFSYRAGFHAGAHGLFFGAGFVCIALGLTVYQESVSKLIPLVNMSTLVTVVLGLFVFSEYTKLNVPSLGVGVCLIVAGGWLVSLS